MTTDRKLNVSGCPLCGIFEKEELPDTNIYHIHDKFMILDMPQSKSPLVVYREHISEVSKEDWGKILDTCRKEFGNVLLGIKDNNKLKENKRLPTTHWWAVCLERK